MTLEHLSYSSISSYLTCGRAWSFKYIENVPTYSSPDLVIGTAVHNTIEMYLEQKPVDGKVEKSLSNLWSSGWSKALERGPVLWGAETPEAACNEGIALINHPAIVAGGDSLKVAWSSDGKAKLEEKVELRVPGIPVPIVGYIDVQTEDVVPGDFKTSARSWNSDKAQSETQSLFYLAALNQAGRTVTDWKFRHYVMVKTKTPQWQVFEHVHKPSEIFWLFGMIQKVWKGIEAGVFPENPTSWKCGPVYCDFWLKCRGRYL